LAVLIVINLRNTKVLSKTLNSYLEGSLIDGIIAQPGRALEGSYACDHGETEVERLCLSAAI